jgi:hypothetical protein
MCKEATSVVDSETKALIRVGRKCPSYGNFNQKTEGCDIMMCGTDAHGRVADALRKGGCALIFNWQTLTECHDDHGYTDLDGNWKRGPDLRTDRQTLIVD